MFLRKIMKKWLVILLVVLLFAFFLFWFLSALPSDETVKREFLQEHPNVEIEGVELIFDYAPKNVLLYSVKFKDAQNDKVKMIDFRLQENRLFQWHWCDDKTERKCE